MAEQPLRVSGGGRALVEAAALGDVAHFLRAGGEDVAEHGHTGGGPALGSASGPKGGGGIVRLARHLGRKEVARAAGGFGAGAWLPDALDEQGGKHGLRLSVAGAAGAFEPAYGLGAAERNALRLEVGEADPILRLGVARVGCAREQREGADNLPLFRQPHRPLIGGAWGQQANEAVGRGHRSQ